VDSKSESIRYYANYKRATLIRDEPALIMATRPILTHQRSFWEIQVYWDADSKGERVVGIATIDAPRRSVLGLDDKGWGYAFHSKGVLYHNGKLDAPFGKGFLSGIVRL
jgi:hypothetical protein